MEKVILISDINTELGFTLLKLYYLNGYKIIGFSTTEIKNLALDEFKADFIEIIPWNRRSPIGVKNLLIKGIARFKTIDEVLILQTIDCGNKRLDQVPVLEIEQYIDMWIKGNCYLAKEVLNFLIKHNRGMITLVNNIQYKNEFSSSPLGEILEASLKALIKNLFKSAKEHNILINGIESTTTQFNKFSEYIYKTVSEKTARASGKLFTFQDKKSFLAGFRTG